MPATQQQDTQVQDNTGRAKGTATGVVVLASGIHARVDEERVRIIAIGDVVGQSPSYLCVNDSGFSEWRSLKQVQIIDPNYLPMSQN